MKRACPAFASILALLLAAPVQAGDPRPRPRPAYANPSAVIAAELAFARAAQEKGQWTAFRETAAADAVMFVPQMAWAQGWLKDRANPPQAVRWQPHQVWSSCDGSLVVSHGAWQRADSVGWFTTIWQRQRDGAYKWVLDHGDTLATPLAAPDLIRANVAQCPPRREASASDAPPSSPQAHQPGGKPKPKKRKAGLPPLDPAHRAGKSDDGTLQWEMAVDPSGARNLSVSWRQGGKQEQALIEQVDAR